MGTGGLPTGPRDRSGGARAGPGPTVTGLHMRRDLGLPGRCPPRPPARSCRGLGRRRNTCPAERPPRPGTVRAPRPVAPAPVAGCPRHRPVARRGRASSATSARRCGWSATRSAARGSTRMRSSRSRRTRSGCSRTPGSSSTRIASRSASAARLRHRGGRRAVPAIAEGLGHDCFAAERERLSDLFEDALSDVGEERLRQGDLAGARRAAEELLARDPLREEAHALLISIHGLIGSRSQVVRQYRRLCRARPGARRGTAARKRGDLPPGAGPHDGALARRAAALGQGTKPTLVAVNA